MPGPSWKCCSWTVRAINAAIQCWPEFEAATGIKVNYTTVPTKTRWANSARFRGRGDLDIALIDLVWIGNFAENGWLVPSETFINKPRTCRPALDMADFFPLVLDAFGSWNGVNYGLAVRQLFGPLVLQSLHAGSRRVRQAAGHLARGDGHLRPGADQDGKYAYALQSKRNENPVGRQLARFLWPFGGSFLNAEFKSNLLSPESQAGLKFRQT